jgi:hypothetical protein
VRAFSSGRARSSALTRYRVPGGGYLEPGTGYPFRHFITPSPPSCILHLASCILYPQVYPPNHAPSRASRAVRAVNSPAIKRIPMTMRNTPEAFSRTGSQVRTF